MDRLPSASEAARHVRWLYYFVAVNIVCSLGLLFSSLTSMRLVFRMIPFATSVLMLVLVRGHGPSHPARPWLWLATAIMGVEIFHPTTYSFLVGGAETALFFAVLAPCLWASRLPLSTAAFERLIQIYWGYHLLSVTFGILQVYFPGTFQPNMSAMVSEEIEDSLKIALANGTWVFRPFGLTDKPGGAAMSGLWACVFGAAYTVFSRRSLVQALGWISMLLGIACIYLCYVRSVFLMVVICLAALGIVMFRRGELSRFTKIAIGCPLILILGFAWASFVGGEDLTQRFASLTERRIDQVYYKNRGIFLEHTIEELLPRYPVGAGHGRWGMMRKYFARFGGNRASYIHAEIQLTGWLLDGGVPLIMTYSVALAVTLLFAYRVATKPALGRLSEWAALVVAYDLACLAVTFNCPLYIGQEGMDFWTFNGALFAATVYQTRLRAQNSMVVAAEPEADRELPLVAGPRA